VNWNRLVQCWPNSGIVDGSRFTGCSAGGARKARDPGRESGGQIVTIRGYFCDCEEARGWLADLIKINTSNPPGNEQIAAMYITGSWRRKGSSRNS